MSAGLRHSFGSPTRGEVDEKIAGALASTRTDVAKYIAGANETIKQLGDEVDGVRDSHQAFADSSRNRLAWLDERVRELEGRTLGGRWRRVKAWLAHANVRCGELTTGIVAAIEEASPW